MKYNIVMREIKTHRDMLFCPRLSYEMETEMIVESYLISCCLTSRAQVAGTK